ncbi:MAG: hypothetical protein HOO99_03850 [Hyphomicrobiaceae bacterium]|nr:hypothetical protein [Hyphomicrobiaceae bacterium]
MAVTYPRAMPSGLYQQEEVNDDRFQSTNLSGGGNTNAAEVSPMLWHGKWSGQTATPQDRSALESWAASLKGAMKYFKGSPVAGRYPLAHRNGWGDLSLSGSPFIGSGVLAATASRTNMALRSQDFDSASWGKDAGVSVSANAMIAPDGTLSADRVTAAGMMSRGISQVFTVSAGTTYTASLWVRLGSLNASDLRHAFYNVSGASFIVLTAPYIVTASVDGFVRLAATVTTPAGCMSLRWYPFFSANATTGTFYPWGAQFELGPAATSYIPTVAAAGVFTPAADEITISSLPNGLTLTPGDWLSFPVGARQRLFKVIEGGVASGGQVNVTVEPSRPPDAVNGVPVRLEEPYCDMQLITPPKRVITNYQMGEFAFEGLQVLV